MTIQESKRAYRERNKEKIREYDRAYRKANAERELERSRAWREANRDRTRAYDRAYREANLEKIRERQHAYREANKEFVQRRRREWREANKERRRVLQQNRRAQKLALPNSFTFEQHQFALNYFHNTCAYCGRQILDLFGERVLAMDHFIPLSSSDCPGTIATNMLPTCHGVDGCNSSKHTHDPEYWIVRRFGKRKARLILARIHEYFEVVRKRCDQETPQRPPATQA